MALACNWQGFHLLVQGFDLLQESSSIANPQRPKVLQMPWPQFTDYRIMIIYEL